jgi:uncharacterized membrane protein
MEPYSIFKLIHILAVVLFMGNIYTGLFWMNRAHRTKDLSIINHTMKNVILSDKYFTVPGVIIILIGGFGAVFQNHLPMLRLGWIFYPIVLFSISGIAFSWKVVPLQKQIYNLTNGSHENFDWDNYNKLFKEWEIWGLVAIVTPIVALAMMVLKLPELSFLAK